MRPPTDSRRATALVITVGLLAVLAIIGFGFAVLSRLQHDSSVHYRSAANVRLLSHACVTYAIRDIRYGWASADPHDGTDDPFDRLEAMRAGAAYQPVESPACPWYVRPEHASGLYVDHNGTPTNLDDDTLRFCYAKNNSYALVHDVLGDQVAVSFVTVLDSAGKININDDNPLLDDMLDTLIGLLEINRYVDPTVRGTLHDLTGNDIVRYRDDTRANGGLGGRYTTLHQLMGVMDTVPTPDVPEMSPRRFEVLKHYLTLYSWPHDPPSVAGFTRYRVDPNHDDTSYPTLESHQGRYRSPININTAPYEVLVAALRSIKTYGGDPLAETKAKAIAKWICRKRDPENMDLWIDWPPDDGLTEFSAEWEGWSSGEDDYKNYVRKRDCYAWRSYPLGPFDTWNEFIDFIYALTDDASTGNGVGDDPFPDELTEEEAEAVIAAVCPNSFATICPRDTWHLGWSRVNKNLTTGQALRDKEPSPADFLPQTIGKNDLDDTSGFRSEFCLSSKGRFEVFSRTFAFVKADFGRVTGKSPNTLTCGGQGKNWASAPPQWRGFSVLIYAGKGKGQLRAIVNNSAEQLQVAKWSTELSTSGDNQSRFYILGPGPLIDRTNTDGSTIDIPGVPGDPSDPPRPHIIQDSEATWGDDEWNGYRLVFYSCDSQGNPDLGSIQERIIIDTVASTQSLVVSPEIDESLCSHSYRGYMILGTQGAAAHEAAVKAYDALYHNTQEDFAPNDAVPGDCDYVAIGPNPIPGNVTTGSVAAVRPSEIDGWVAVAKKPVTTADIFSSAPGTLCLVQNFDHNDFATTTGAWQTGTARGTLVQDVFDGGRLFPDGLCLRTGSTHWAGFSTSPATMVRQNSTSDGDQADGGFVSLWFRPDPGCLGGRLPHHRARTIVRIKGKDSTVSGKHNDLRLLLANTTLKLVVRADGQQPYKGKTLHDASGNPITVNCLPSPDTGSKTYWTGPYLDVHDTDKDPIRSKWKAGEWHHICFAWYEVTPNSPQDDGPGPDNENDGPPDTSYLDEGQMLAKLRMWVDGELVDDDDTVQAFNLIPDSAAASHPAVCIGEEASAPAGTVDGILAYAHQETNLANFDSNIKSLNEIYRYEKDNTPTYTSTAINFPSAISGEPIALGCVSWTGLYPWCDKDAQDWKDHWDHYPIRVRVSLDGGSTWSEWIPESGQSKQPVLGGGGPLRKTGTVDPEMVRRTSASSIQYQVEFDPYVGQSTEGVPKYWQTPVLDDITITFFTPPVFYHWR